MEVRAPVSARSECGGDLRDDRMGLPGEAPPGEAQHVDAGGAQDPVAATIPLERGSSAVKLVAVDLDRDVSTSVARPQEIDLEAVAVDVDQRRGQPGVADERQEPLLGL